MEAIPNTIKSTRKAKYDLGRIIMVALELGAHVIAGYILLSNFTHLLAVATGIYLLATAGLIVLYHIAKAYRA